MRSLALLDFAKKRKDKIIGGFYEKNIGILVLCLVLCGRIFSQENKINVNNDADLIFLNGTGERITDIEIRSAESKGICSMSNIVFEDQKALGIDLPSRMEKHNKFQVIIKYGKRTAKTKNIEIVCKKNNIAPTYLLTIAGKDSSIPLAAAFEQIEYGTKYFI